MVSPTKAMVIVCDEKLLFITRTKMVTIRTVIIIFLIFAFPLALCCPERKKNYGQEERVLLILPFYLVLQDIKRVLFFFRS
jgi:hypothetical protein